MKHGYDYGSHWVKLWDYMENDLYMEVFQWENHLFMTIVLWDSKLHQEQLQPLDGNQVSQVKGYWIDTHFKR